MRILSFILLLLSIQVAQAQVRPLKDGAEARLWQAVGVVAVDRQPICTGTLIAPDLVLTAAHCVYSGYTKKLYSPERLAFWAGWRNGSSAARRQAVGITAYKKYDPVINSKYLTSKVRRNITYDIAVIELDTPVQSDQVEPIATLNRIRDRDKFDLVSYGEGRMDYPSIQEGCTLLDRRSRRYRRGGETYGRRSNLPRLSCKGAPGMSGAPIFGYLLGKPRIVALVSSGLEKKRNYVTVLGATFAKTLPELMSDREAVRSLNMQPPPFWDSGQRTLVSSPTPTPVRRIIRPGGTLNLPQN